MKKTAEQQAAVSGPEAEEKSPRRRVVVGGRSGFRSGVAAPKPVTVRIPDLTPPTDHEDLPALDDDLDEEEFEETPRVTSRTQSAPRTSASPKPEKSKSSGSKPSSRPASRPQRESTSDDERPRRERIGERRRRESAPRTSSAKPKVGAGPVLIGMGLVGLILAGYAAIQKNQQKSTDADGASATAWQDPESGEFVAPKVDLPGEAMTPEEFAASQQKKSDSSVAAPELDATAGGYDSTRFPEGAAPYDPDQLAEDQSASEPSMAQKPPSYGPGSTWQDTPVTVYGRSPGDERTNEPYADYPPESQEADVARERAPERVADRRAYPTTNPETYRYPPAGQGVESYRLGRRDPIDTSADQGRSSNYGPENGAAPRGRFEQSPDQSATDDATGYDGGAQRSAPYGSDPRDAGGYPLDAPRGGNRDANPYDSRGFNQRPPATPQGAAGGRGYDPSARAPASDERLGDAPAYESARAPSERQPGDARLQGGIQTPYNGSRYERPRSSVY